MITARLAATAMIAMVLATGCTSRPTSVPTASPVQPASPPQTGRVSASASPSGLSGTLRVGAPCGLAMAYKEVRTLFLKQNPSAKFVDHVKNIGPMIREVRDQKISLDVFLSLGELEIRSLADAGLVQGKSTPFLRQAMQLLVRKGNPLGIRQLDDLARPAVKTVVLCVPELTLGHAAAEALTKAGVLAKLDAAGKVIRVDQPAEGKRLVIEGKADATFIYGACSSETWRASDPERSVVGKAHVVTTVPESQYGGMFAVAAVLKGAQNPELARKFVDFLLTPEAQEALAKRGYGKVDR
jgi:molybdate transport system substrate-binding protein